MVFKKIILPVNHSANFYSRTMFGRMIESSFFWPNDGSAERLKIMPCQKRFLKKSFCRSIVLPISMAE
jgi:hypothetical protein